MRTTLAIDDDVLIAAKSIARQQQRSIGEVISDLARRALRRPESPVVRNGMNLIARGDDQTIVTLETVNALRDELP
jgi:hypothetical protein